jgi:transposase
MTQNRSASPPGRRRSPKPRVIPHIPGQQKLDGIEPDIGSPDVTSSGRYNATTLTRDEAETLVTAIQFSLDAAWQYYSEGCLQLIAAHKGRAWIPLGLANWEEFVSQTIDVDHIRIPKPERRAIVAALREGGLTLRAIASATGLSVGTTHRELSRGVPNGTHAVPTVESEAPNRGVQSGTKLDQSVVPEELTADEGSRSVAGTAHSEVLTSETKVEVTHPSVNGAGKPAHCEWYTDARIMKVIRSVMGSIDLDPASHPDANRVVRAQQFFTFEDDGLTKTWEGRRVWCNPPFGAWDEWAAKIYQEWSRGGIGDLCVLIGTRSLSAKANVPLLRSASAVCITKGRIPFWGPHAKSAPNDGHAILYFGERPQSFNEAFEESDIATPLLMGTRRQAKL